MKKIICLLGLAVFLTGCSCSIDAPSYNDLKQENTELKAQLEREKRASKILLDTNEEMYNNLEKKYNLLINGKYPQYKLFLDAVEDACYCSCEE